MIKKLSNIDADFDRQLSDLLAMPDAVSYTHLTLPTTPYV